MRVPMKYRHLLRQTVGMPVAIEFYDSASQILVVLLLAESLRVGVLFKDREVMLKADDSMWSLDADMEDLKVSHKGDPTLPAMEKRLNEARAEFIRLKNVTDRKTNWWTLSTCLVLLGELIALLTCLLVLGDPGSAGATTATVVAFGMSFGFSGVAMHILLPLKVDPTLKRERFSNALIYVICAMSFVLPVGLLALLH